jgi:outer membrane protein assembly factor BamD
MNRIYKLTLISLSIALLIPQVSYGAWIWTPETGRWFNPKHAVKDTAQEQLEWAMEFYEAGDFKRAISELKKLVEYYPNSKHAPVAQYYIGRCYEDLESYFHAYLAYQHVIEAYPHAKNREEIIKRQYEIGMLFFEGRKAKMLGLAVLPATDKAIEIFEQVIVNSPYGEYADKSLFKVGEAYKKTNRFAEAALAFQRLVEEYPSSELAQKANYEVAQCGYLASLGYSYDQEITDAAIDKFRDFIEDADSEELTQQAKDSLRKLKDKKAEGLYDTAKFYEKTGKYNSAILYYKELADKYPESPLAADAVNRQMKLESRVSRKRERQR